MTNTQIAYCQWDDETVRERTDNPPSYAVAKKMKSITLHTHGCLRAKGMIFFFFIDFRRILLHL